VGSWGFLTSGASTGSTALGFGAGSELERMLEKDMGSARLGVLVEAEVGAGLGDAAGASVLMSGGRAELPFVFVDVILMAGACLDVGEAILEWRADGLMEPAGAGIG
jgi:hypothetical protein